MNLTQKQKRLLIGGGVLGVLGVLGVVGIIIGIIVSIKKAADKKKAAAEKKAAEKKAAEEIAAAELLIDTVNSLEITMTRTDVADDNPNKKNVIIMPSSYFLNTNNGNPFIEGCWSILDTNTLKPTAGITCNNSTIVIKLPYNVKATPLLANKDGNFACSREITDTRKIPVDVQAGGEAGFGPGICGFKFTKTNDSPKTVIAKNTVGLGDNLKNIVQVAQNP